MLDFFEKLSVFDDIKYYDEPHVYFIGDRQLTVSATGIIKKYKQPFDSDYWSKYKAKKLGVTQADILTEWDLKRVTSTVKGSIFHDYAENYLSNKVFAYPTEMVLSTPEFMGVDLVIEKIEKLKIMFHKFHAAIQGRMIPIKSEFVIGDPSLDMGGMIDQLFYNKKTGMLEIWDWKTNKEIKTKNNYNTKMIDVMSSYDDCELSHYSLQLAIYKFVFERRTGIKLGCSRIAYFHEKHDTVRVYDCIDMEREVKLIFGCDGNKYSD